MTETETEFKERRAKKRKQERCEEFLSMIEILKGPGTTENKHKTKLIKTLERLAGK